MMPSDLEQSLRATRLMLELLSGGESDDKTHDQVRATHALELVKAAIDTMNEPMAALWPALQSEEARKRCMNYGGYEIARQALLEWSEVGPGLAKDYLERIVKKGGRS